MSELDARRDRDVDPPWAERLARLVSHDLDPAWRRRQRVLLGWLAEAGPGPTLDLGCGLGFSLGLARALGRAGLVGIDADRLRLARARDRGANALVCAVGERLPFASGRFAAVLASEVLEHVADDTALLGEVARVLRPGGLLALSVPNACYPASYDPLNAGLARLGVAPIRRGPLAGIWTDHRRLYRGEQLRGVVASAGLEVLELRRLTRRTLPFLHLGLYAVGAPLLGALPRRVAVRFDRSAPGTRTPAALAPLGAWIDRIDAASRDAGEPPGTPTVNLALLARAPGPPPGARGPS